MLITNIYCNHYTVDRHDEYQVLVSKLEKEIIKV